MNMIEAAPMDKGRSFVSRMPTWVVSASAILVTMSGLAYADPITNLGTGLLNAGNGSVIVTGNGSTSGCIDFYNTTAPTTCQPDNTTASLSVNGGSTAPFVPGQTGTIKDLNFNTPFPVVNFIQIGTGALAPHFDLRDLRFNVGPAIGDCTTALDAQGRNDMSPGVTCTPAGSPFQITNGLAGPSGVADTVSVTLTVDAWGYTGSPGTNYSNANPYVGIFTTQQALAGNIATILNTINTGGAINASWSATFAPVAVAPIPEPVTFGLFGAGLMFVGALGRRYRRP